MTYQRLCEICGKITDEQVYDSLTPDGHTLEMHPDCEFASRWDSYADQPAPGDPKWAATRSEDQS